jgi:hypothetical protein
LRSAVARISFRPISPPELSNALPLLLTELIGAIGSSAATTHSPL